MTDAAEAFEAHRASLVRIAYRMLGSVAEAEDVVQDAFLRWNATDRAAVHEPRAFLTRAVTRLCLDRLKSARAQREEYVGTWLPEPLVEEEGTQLAHDLSVALIVTLQRLSPLERAAFLLHDVFDMGFADVADVLERSEAAVRQLASRAREHVQEDRPRFHASDEAALRLADAFKGAMVTGDVATLSKLLAEDAVFYADGGGKRAAFLKPLQGREPIVRVIQNLVSKGVGVPGAAAFHRAWINGMPGFVVHTKEGVETMALEINDGVVAGIYVVRNPDKLRHLS